MAMRSWRFGHSAAIQLSKQRPNRSGSTRLTRARSQRSPGMPWWKGEKRRRTARWCVPQATMSSKSSQEAMVAQVTRSSTAWRGESTRQGSRASSRAANSFRSRRRRSRGRSAPGRISPMSVARVWALPGLGGMGGLRAEFAAGTETPHPSHRKKQALPAVHPNSKPWHGLGAGPWSWDLQRLGSAAQGGVVGNRESETEQTNDGADQAFGLAQGQAEHGLERQRRRDRQSRIVRLAARRGAGLGVPGRDRRRREPDRQTPALA